MSSIPLLKRAMGSRTFHTVNKTGNVRTWNTGARSCNHCCSGKLTIMNYFEYFLNIHGSVHCNNILI